MSSFESRGSGNKATGEYKHPLKRVEPAVRKFITVLRIDLDRLQKHKQNIVKLEALGEVDALDKEQVNASRTIQQLKANVKQLENTRAQVRDEDLEKFDAKVRTLQTDAVVAVTDFLNSHGSGGQSPLKELSSNRIGPSHPKSFGCEEENQEETSLDDIDDAQTQLVVDQHLPSQESWNRLHEDLEDLNGIIHEFASLVEGQQEKVDEIEQNVGVAAENVHEGTKNIIMANKWKAAVFPVAGALVGGLVGGPIGLAAGLKLGGLAAVGGGIAGFTGGTILKKKQEQFTSTELQNLKDSRSKSVPEQLSSAASSEGAFLADESRTENVQVTENKSIADNVESVGPVQNKEEVETMGTVQNEEEVAQPIRHATNDEEGLDLIQVEDT